MIKIDALLLRKINVSVVIQGHPLANQVDQPSGVDKLVAIADWVTTVEDLSFLEGLSLFSITDRRIRSICIVRGCLAYVINVR